MKRRNIIVAISLIGAALFLFTTHVLYGDVKVTQLPESSPTRPALKENTKDTVKKGENKKTNLALKVKLILSRFLPLFPAKQTRQ